MTNQHTLTMFRGRREIKAGSVFNLLFRGIEYNLIVPRNIFEEFARGLHGVFVTEFLKNVGDGATSINPVVHALLSRIDEEEEVVEEMSLVQECAGSAGRKSFLDADGPGAANRHVMQ